MRINRLVPACLLAATVAVLGGCSNVGYYSQAVGGHVRLMLAREPIDKLLADATTSEELRGKLRTLVDARQFAVERLQLPDNDSYDSYVETGRDAVTWNVVAAGEFSLQARTWCFPVAGCVSYRGYFDKADAEAYAAQLAAEDYDVSVGGASAYSTLGWFDDPVLDTMLRGTDVRFVGTLFHELAHQVLYVKDDSNFNEAFATFVEQQGVRQWLAERGESERIEAYNASQQRVVDFLGLLRQTRDELQALYAQDLPDAAMRTAKQATFDNMRDAYDLLKQQWGGYAGYDNWFRRELNNARLVAVSTYRRDVPAFQAMYEEAGQDMSAFYELARRVGKLPYKERRSRIAEYDAKAAGKLDSP
ncbi:aminopeptidase [Granulosicoccus sp. 3-233]|uniref:aminopeptidase n=1 Tax=Granulosicoccus sp. 3-233 TaxID=3417969 RepID=UPI003D3253D9